MGYCSAGRQALYLHHDSRLAKSFQPGSRFFSAAHNATSPQAVFSNYVNGILTAFFMLTVLVLTLYSIRTSLAALKKLTAKEVPYAALPVAWRQPSA